MRTQLAPTGREPLFRTPGARRAVIASMVGTLIEWYDYALYGVAAGLVIGPLFFPEALPGTATLLSLATFAVGFGVRPFGGLLIAHLGDKYGRKPALLLTIVLMGIATAGIGLLPTAASIGLAAPILLVVLRALQGFGAGAELSGALTVAAEYTPPSRRGLATALINSCSGVGSAVAILAFLLISAVPKEVLLGGLWRVPFLASAVLFLLALYIRKRLEETPEYQAATASAEAAHASQAPLAEVVRHSPKRVLLGIALWSGHNANTYIVLTFALAYLTGPAVGMDRGAALWITLSASLLGGAVTPLWGLVGDRLGYRRIYLMAMTIGVVVVVPVFLGLGSGQVIPTLLALLVSSCVIWGATQATAGAVTTNLFPVRQRFSGVAIAKEINAAVVAGPTPFIAAALIEWRGPLAAAAFIAACFVVTILSLLALDGGDTDVPAQARDDLTHTHLAH